MKARTRNAVGTLVLLVTLFAVGGIAYVGVHLRGEERARADADEKKVFAFQPGAVKALRVVAKGDDVRLVRGEGGAWRIVAPAEAPADPEAVRRLLERLASLEKRGVSSAAGASRDALANYGLDDPQVRIEAEIDDGRTERLALGDTSGFDGAMFVMPTDGRVLVVAGHARMALEQGLSDLKEKPTPPPEPAPKTGG